MASHVVVAQEPSALSCAQSVTSSEEVAELDGLAPTLDSWARNPDLLKPPEALIPNLAWRGRITCYSALDKGGKSTLAAAGVAAASSGAAFLGQCGGGAVRVVWLCLEEPLPDLIQRLQAFGANRANVRIAAFPPDARTYAKRIVKLWQPDVVVIDTLIRYSKGHVTKSGESAQWALLMQDFIEMARHHNTSVLLLHHAQRRGGEARDSGDITAACDVILEQKKRHSATGVQRVDVRARFALNNFAVKLDGKTYRLLKEKEPDAAPSDDLGAAQACLQALGEQRLTATAWREASGEQKSTFFEHRAKLVDNGYVEQLGKQYGATDKGRAALNWAS